MRTITASLALMAFLLACGNPSADEVTPEDKERITAEIKERVAQYVKDCQALDFEAIMSFYRKTEDFVWAGDGKILGGYDDRAEIIKQFVEEVEGVPFWENRNIHVIVLSKKGAVCTFEFDVTNKMRSGKRVKREGAWTFVFRNYNGAWKAVAGNGTHIDQEYE